jgi:hypothetical protein
MIEGWCCGLPIFADLIIAPGELQEAAYALLIFGVAALVAMKIGGGKP